MGRIKERMDWTPELVEWEDEPKSASDLSPDDVHVPALIKCRCGKELNHAGPHRRGA